MQVYEETPYNNIIVLHMLHRTACTDESIEIILIRIETLSLEIRTFKLQFIVQ